MPHSLERVDEDVAFCIFPCRECGSGRGGTRTRRSQRSKAWDARTFDRARALCTENLIILPPSNCLHPTTTM
jgi:hypothetical protein